jgi:hypothetical protein
MRLKPKERDIVLAALRFWQDERKWFTENNEGTYLEIATNSGAHKEMTLDEIDEFCERLNQ